MNKKENTKIGNISVEIFRESIRLRFRVSGKRYSLTIGKYSSEAYKAAIAKAKQIEADILWNNFDNSLEKYGKQPKIVNLSQPAAAATEVTIIQIWENYLTVKGDGISKSVVVTHHPIIDKWIAKIPDDRLGISHYQQHIDYLRLTYAKNTVSRVFQIINAAANLAVNLKLIDHNPYSVYRGLITSTKGDRSCKPFQDYEVPIILDAFKSNRFCSSRSKIKHSYYYPFVLGLTLTGARPEEIVALTYDDIISSNSRKFLRINKAYTHGALGPTKTKTNRLFPINEQLQGCLNLAPEPLFNPTSLIFPSWESRHINLGNFTTRYFTPIVKRLVELGEVENQLPTYHLRHTFITQMIRKGIDIATIANLVGNSPETILSNYLGANKDIELPELF